MSYIYTLCGLFIILSSCSSNENPFSYGNDTHSRGEMVLYVEESFKPLFKTSINTFESQYPTAHIQPKYSSEGEIIKEFFNGNVKTICISRDFTEKEKKVKPSC
jgi:phosphate transport system substrate-binding protein